MSISTPMKASYDRMVKKYYESARLDGFIFTVRIIHEEGSEFLLQNAFYDNWSDDDFLWVISEHQGYFIFAKNELCFFAKYKKIDGYDIVDNED